LASTRTSFPEKALNVQKTHLLMLQVLWASPNHLLSESREYVREFMYAAMEAEDEVSTPLTK
jgi:hypothetical protein